MSRRRKIGSFDLPSGNHCDIRLGQDKRGFWKFWLSWESPPPLTPEDHTYFVEEIVPVMTDVAKRLTGFTVKVPYDE